MPTRPKNRPGTLWLRVTLKDGTEFDGTVPNNLKSIALLTLPSFTMKLITAGHRGPIRPIEKVFSRAEMESSVVLGVIGDDNLKLDGGGRPRLSAYEQVRDMLAKVKIK